MKINHIRIIDFYANLNTRKKHTQKVLQVRRPAIIRMRKATQEPR